jgi:hypothetical protein
MTGAMLQLAMRQKVARRELVGPHVVTTTPLVDGLNADGRPVWPGSTVVTDETKAVGVVENFGKAGYSQLKVYQLLTPEVHQALAAAAQKLGMRVTGHCPDGMTFEQAIANHAQLATWIADGFDGFQRAAAGKDSQPPKELLLGAVSRS